MIAIKRVNKFMNINFPCFILDCLFCKRQYDDESNLEERVRLTSDEKEYNKNSFKKGAILHH